MTRPAFRCTAYEPPARKGGMYGKKIEIDSGGGLVLDEFVLGSVIHVEQMSDDFYYARVGKHVFNVYREHGAWRARLHEVQP